ncbi:MAG: purine-nucleoside phosphorylase [Bdellovibrionaceae bacterium]|jgi:purine-nucleoside phosphorylase|nr:purine-nucleoside phosphorylase [Pseudobdellovibrionaceae bacterium]
MDNEIQKVNEACEYIKSKCKITPTLGLTLGSGLGSFAKEINIEMAISYSDIPHFIPPTIEGHSGKLILGHIGKTPIAVLQGRVHFYEGHSMNQVVFPTRVLCALGVNTLILTNAAGGIGTNMKPGDFMIIEDHINMMGTNPLIGKNYEKFGTRFPDMSQVYDQKLIEHLEEDFVAAQIQFSKGIYCAMTGPSYESPAEIQFLKTIGASAVGMSTVPEAIAAKHMGKRVLGISCITNYAAGLSDDALSHDDVKDVAAKVETTFNHILTDFITHNEF